MTNKVEVDAASLAKMIADGVAAALAANKATKKAKGGKPGRKPQTDEEKAKNRAKVDAETIAKFEAAGYKNVVPRETVKTYQRWLMEGRLVQKGQKAIKCGSFPLFHLDQTAPMKSEGTVH